MIKILAALFFLFGGQVAVAEPQAGAGAGMPAAPPPVSSPASPEPMPDLVQSPMQALVQDAAEYARQYDVSLNVAVSRLRAQQDSIAATDAIAAEFRDRFAGMVIEHAPAYRIVVRLTGDDPVPDRMIPLDGLAIPVVFQPGAAVSRDEILSAIERHQAELRRAVANPPGMGVDPWNGALVLLVRERDVAPGDAGRLAKTLGEIAGVPVEIRLWNDVTRNLAVEGGGRVIGLDGAERPRRLVCTTGFAVTKDGLYGMTTAAHCPDEIDYIGPGGERLSLTMLGAWGERYQDVQIHAIPGPAAPLFYVDASKRVSRAVLSWRNRQSTRVGDFVCHRGESTGYSCGEVEFVDFAPPGDLCAGLCKPVWVGVRGPGCKRGDSGGPVFSGNIAFGILKGASFTSDGVCRLYYYMSTDYLPAGWTLLHW